MGKTEAVLAALGHSVFFEKKETLNISLGGEKNFMQIKAGVKEMSIVSSLK